MMACTSIVVASASLCVMLILAYRQVDINVEKLDCWQQVRQQLGTFSLLVSQIPDSRLMSVLCCVLVIERAKIVDFKTFFELFIFV